jgi:hypothetical protein
MKEESSDERNAALAGEFLAGLLDHAPAGWSAEALTHNAHIAVTAGIWRVRAGPASFVLKVLSPGGTAASGEWSPSGDPTHWNYWEREALAYESGVTSTYSGAGIPGPRLLASHRRPSGDVALWLEDASGGGDSVPGTGWSAHDYRRFARALGVAQGSAAVAGTGLDHPWLTRRSRIPADSSRIEGGSGSSGRGDSSL